RHRWPEKVRLMVRRLKTYQTSLGFFDLAIAAPSMKAAADAWGLKTNEFKRGFAKETHNPAIVAATMAKPGIVLRRPVGSNGPFSEHAELPEDLPSRIKKKPPTPQRRQTNRRVTGWTTKPLATLHLRSRESRSGAKAHVGRKRPHGRRSANAESRQSQRRKRRLRQPSE